MSAIRTGHEGPAGTGIVLLHGAGLGGWIWRDVVPHLAGPSLPVDFPGRGRPPEERRALSFEDYVASVAAQVRAFPPRRIVLVAHSVAGILVPRLVRELPDRVVGLAAVAAAIPRPGGSFISTLPVPQRYVIGAIVRVFGTRPTEGAIRKGLCSDLPAGLADEVVDRFDPESRALYRSPVTARGGEVPTVYVRLTRDREFGVSLQDRMARNLDAGQVVDIPSGHMPMLSQPVELARVINDFVADLT